MKYIDINKLYKQVDELMAHFAELEKETKPDDEDLSIFYQGKVKMCSELLSIIDSLQQEQTEGWNKADCVKEIPFSLIYEEFAEHWRLGKAVEPGNYYIPISRLRWGIKGNLEEIPSNVDLDKAAEEYRRESYRKSVLPNIDGPTLEYDGNVKTAFIAGAQWMENQFEHCGTFPIEDSRGGYWPTDYYIKKK